MSQKNKVIPEVEYNTLIKIKQEKEQLEQKLKKYATYQDIPEASIELSRYHDFEAIIRFFKKDENGKELRDDRGYRIYDPDVKIFHFNTVQMSDILKNGKGKLIVYSTEKKDEPT